MGVRWVTGFLDTPSRVAEAFWQAVTGSGLSARRGPGGEFATLVPAGGRALVDQMCLDVPVGGFDAEADFWAALTGWRRQPGSLPEFDSLVRPDGMPLRLLLQRVDAAAGMHLDLACTDRAAEVAWHVSLGAEVVAVYGRWTTLRDPAGRAYCVTDRPG